MNESWLQWGALLGASLAAAILDVRHGRIPNVLTASLWLLGLAQAMAVGGVSGLGGALGVSALLASPYIVLSLVANGGAGDAKLMAGLGAWLSLPEGIIVFCCVALAGMVLAILRLMARPERRQMPSQWLASLYVLGVAACSGVRGVRLVARPPEGQTSEPAGEQAGTNGTQPPGLPYGVAIFIGVCMGAVGARIWLGHSG